ncbi:MAG TPA: hypothetical protein VFX61_10450 [Micromonosporaceae bacterium]|nr:hypothetical protein [Micromonosporaceae bacterium]
MTSLSAGMSQPLVTLTHGHGARWRGVTLNPRKEKNQMKIRRLAIGGLSLFTALSLTISGCGTKDAPGGGDDKGSSNATEQKPIDALLASTQAVTKESFKMKMESSVINAEGAMDLAGEKMSMSMEMGDAGESMSIKMLMLGKDMYMQMAFPGMEDKWMHLDTSDVKSGSLLDKMRDPAGVNEFSKTIVEIERDGDRGFKGTMDMAKAADADDETKAMGDKAKVPFTVRLDDQGRMVEFMLDMTEMSPEFGKLTVTYSDFGAPVTVEKPAADQIVDAPAEMTKALTEKS